MRRSRRCPPTPICCGDGARRPGCAAPHGLSRARIVAAAVTIADVDGLDAVSMPRLARMLGSAPMSLYRHVPHKDALVDLMLDAAVGPPAPRGRPLGPLACAAGRLGPREPRRLPPSPLGAAAGHQQPSDGSAGVRVG